MRFSLAIKISLLSAMLSTFSQAAVDTEFNIKLMVYSKPCNVNVTQVNFGTLSPQNINDIKYRKKLNIYPGCDQSATKFIVKFDGNPTNAGTGLLAAYDENNNVRNDLGIRIEENNGDIINILDQKEYANSTFPDIFVRPYTKDTLPLKAGTFSSYATLSIWYE